MPRTTLRIRMAPLAFACGANTLLVAWLAFDKPATPRRSVAPTTIWLELPPQEVRTVPRESVRPSEVAVRERRPPVQVPVPEPATAIEHPLAPTNAPAAAAPSIDWSAAIGEAVRNGVASAAAEHGSVLDSKPLVMELPKEKERPHKLGDSEFSNGATIVWINERCYLESQVLDRHGMPRTVCKNRSMADRRSEDRAEAIERAVKQKRSGSPGK